MTIDLRKIWHKQDSSSLSTCLIPDCKGRAIEAHSIPNAAVVSKVAVEGHVCALSESKELVPNPELRFKRVGRHKASVFTGLCSRHDQLFAKVDQLPIDPDDPESRFLLSYRSVLQQLYANRNALHKSNVFMDGLPRVCREEIKTQFYPIFVNAVEFESYAKWFHQSFARRNFGRLWHRKVQINNAMPDLAVSSCFSFRSTSNMSEQLEKVVMNVWPSGPKIIALFTCQPRHKGLVERYLEPMLTQDRITKIRCLSQIVLSCTENFILSPSIVDSFDVKTTQVIKNLFRDTIIQRDFKFERGIEIRLIRDAVRESE